MDPKILTAFALGLIVASGVAYLASRPSSPHAVVQQQPVPVETPAQKREPLAVAAQTPDPEPEQVRMPAAAAKPRAPKPTPVVAAGNRPNLAEKAPDPAPVSTSGPSPTPPPSSNAPIFLPPPPPPADLPAKVEPAPAPAPTPTPTPTIPVVKEAPKPNTVTIPAGTMLNARIMEPLSSERNQPGDRFHATLDQALVVDGFVIAERGAKLDGRVTEVDRSGKVKGLARLALEITKLHTTDGQVVEVQTSAFERKAERSAKSDAMKVGLGAAIGAAIGGIAGGGKGAATGAGMGGAAGAGQVLLTRGKAAEIKVETRIPFRLRESLTLTEKLSN